MNTALVQDRPAAAVAYSASVAATRILSEREIRDQIAKTDAIWASVDTILDHTSSCFRQVVIERRRVGDMPAEKARIFLHIDRLFGVVCFGAGRDILLPLDVWIG